MGLRPFLLLIRESEVLWALAYVDQKWWMGLWHSTHRQCGRMPPKRMEHCFALLDASDPSGIGTEIGAFSTLFTLVTGGFRGKPMWGAFWVWDAHLTSVFILFLIYLGALRFQKLSVVPAPISIRAGASNNWKSLRRRVELRNSRFVGQ